VCLVPGIRSVSLVSAEFGHAKGTGVGPRRPGARRRWVMRHQAAVPGVSAGPRCATWPRRAPGRWSSTAPWISHVSAVLAASRLQIGLPSAGFPCAGAGKILLRAA